MEPTRKSVKQVFQTMKIFLIQSEWFLKSQNLRGLFNGISLGGHWPMRQVPIKGGILRYAMGLIKDEERYAILSDIFGARRSSWRHGF
ncbi:MAG: hypothetical protein CM1200mP33_4540 [Chloroflexota bacterium]|nr:MAG: hypothetical protein CM1200mP33_4540 [Chloroflexota bacterium]